MRRAQLNNAILTNANLNFANLPGTDFSGADLFGANFSNTNLEQADFTAALIYNNTDFTGCTGTPIGTPAQGTLPTCS